MPLVGRLVAALRGSLPAKIFVGDHGDRGVIHLLEPCLEKQRRLDNGRARRRLVYKRALAEAADFRANKWPDKRLEPDSLVVVGKSEPRQRSTINGASWRGISAPALNDAINYMLLLIERMDYGVGRKGQRTEPFERVERSALARPHTPGQANERDGG